jgi:hypothetical protein
MSRWRPKSSKLGGGLPNYTYKPRKPVPLIFCIGVECISGIFVFQDVVQYPELQFQKAFFHGKNLLSQDRDTQQLQLTQLQSCIRLMELRSQKADGMGWDGLVGSAAQWLPQ